MSTKVIINTNQLSLWHEIMPVVPANVGRFIVPAQNVNDENEVTSQSISLLPVTAKDGVDSLKSRNPNATAEQLKAMHKEQSLELKTWLAQQAAVLQANDTVGGVGIRYTKGRVALVFKRLAPQVALLTDEQIAERMGQTVEWVRKNCKRQTPLIDAGTGKELKPAPQNGTPELVPVKKGGKKSGKAPEAPAPQQ